VAEEAVAPAALAERAQDDPTVPVPWAEELRPAVAPSPSYPAVHAAEV
jgi:hypothetical protein